MSRRKLLLITLPITATMWLIGWILSWAGSQEDKDKLKKDKIAPN